MRDFFRQHAPDLLDDVEKFVKAHTAGYVRDLKNGRHGVSEKQINDPVWKTIRLSESEVALLDSPLVQRLRRIKQLGVVELVFPGGGYSRLASAQK